MLVADGSSHCLKSIFSFFFFFLLLVGGSCPLGTPEGGEPPWGHHRVRGVRTVEVGLQGCVFFRRAGIWHQGTSTCLPACPPCPGLRIARDCLPALRVSGFRRPLTRRYLLGFLSSARACTDSSGGSSISLPPPPTSAPSFHIRVRLVSLPRVSRSEAVCSRQAAGCCGIA